MPIVIYDARNSFVIPVKDPRVIGAGKNKQKVTYAPLAARKKGFPPNIVRLIGGANELTQEQWDAVVEAHHPKVEKYLLTGKIAVLTSKGVSSNLEEIKASPLPDKLKNVKNLQGLDPKDAILVAENTMTVEVLQNWIEEETRTVARQSVLDALEKQLKRVREVEASGKPKGTVDANKAGEK